MKKSISRKPWPKTPGLKTPGLKNLLDLVKYDASEIKDPSQKRMVMIRTNLAIAEIALMRVEKLIDEAS